MDISTMNGENMEDSTSNVEEELWRFLRHNRLEDFRDRLNQITIGNISADLNYAEQGMTMLQYCSKHNRLDFAELLIEADCDPNRTTEDTTHFPLVIAALAGHSEMVRLLTSRDLQLNRTLSGNQTVLHRVAVRLPQDLDRYLDCLKILLSKEFTMIDAKNNTDKGRIEKIDINAQDINGNTALHYATYSDSEEAILELLRHGASFNLTNILGDIALHKIKPSTLEAFFGSLIVQNKFSNDNSNDMNCNSIVFDYSFFASASPKSASGRNMDSNIGLETEAMWHLSRSPRHRHLLKHQLVSSFLKLKWHTIQRYHYFDLLYFSIVTVFATLALLFSRGSNGQYHYFMVVAFALLFVRELVQAVCAWCPYFFTLQNYITMGILLGMAIDIALWFQTNYNFPMSTIGLPFLCFKLLLLMGIHPKCSTLIAMFTAVMTTFLRLLLVFPVMLFGFLISFLIVFRNPGDMSNEINDTSESILLNVLKSNPMETIKEDNDNKDENSTFSNVPFLVLKILVMMTGEIDLGNLPFSNSPVLSRIVFIVFFFLITIVLFNLLNALAISDIQEIRCKAEIVGYINQMNFIFYLERIIAGQSPASVDYQYLKACPVMAYMLQGTLNSLLERSPRSYNDYVNQITGNFLQKFHCNRKIFLFYKCLPKKKLVIYPNRKSDRLSNNVNGNKVQTCSCHAKFNVNNLVD